MMHLDRKISVDKTRTHEKLIEANINAAKMAASTIKNRTKNKHKIINGLWRECKEISERKRTKTYVASHSTKKLKQKNGQ